MSGNKGFTSQRPMDAFKIPDLANVSHQCSIITGPMNKNECAKEISHPFVFDSVYRHFSFDGLPEVSTYHSQGACNPDFIFYTVKDKITVDASFYYIFFFFIYYITHFSGKY